MAVLYRKIYPYLDTMSAVATLSNIVLLAINNHGQGLCKTSVKGRTQIC